MYGERTKTYIAIKATLTQIVKIAFPIIIGTSIELTSFTNVAGIIFVITIIQLIISYFIKTDINKIDEFNLLKYIHKIKLLKEEKSIIQSCYKIAFLEGIVSSLLGTLITVIIMMTFQTAFNLGALTTVFSICTIIVAILFKQFYKRKYAKSCITICMIVPILSVIGLAFDINKTTVIIYNFMNAIFMALLSNISSTQRYNSIDKTDLKQNKIEHQSLYEIILACGRVVGFLILLLVSFLNNIIYFKILLCIITLFIIPYAINLYKMETSESK